MDKLIHDTRGKATVSNDGATVMKLLDIVHPAAATLVDVARSQDEEVGDGTTSVVLFAGELLKEAKPFVEEGVHSQVIIKAYRQALGMAMHRLREVAETVDSSQQRNLLERCATTALTSKLVAAQKDFFGKMVVDAVLHLDQETLPIEMIGVKKVGGGSLEDSLLVEGVAFKKTFSYAGFEQQPKKFRDAHVLLLNVELELKAEKDNAEVRIEDPSQYQSIVDAEWSIIFDKLAKIVATGAKIILSRLAIGDLATQYFADRGLFCAGRVSDDDLRRVAKATGGAVQTSVNNLVPDILGHVGLFEEQQVGAERYNFFTECPLARTATIILRGGAEEYVEEAERSLHDAIMIVRRAIKNTSVVAGGGAIEMELSKCLREEARKIHGKSQLLINAFAKALEVIPRTLTENAGFDATNILNKLRQIHWKKGEEGKWFGVDIINEGVCDTFKTFVWEPTLVKQNAITAATEAACLILSVDETVRNPKSQNPADNDTPIPMGGRGRGMMPPRRGRGMGGRGRPF
eukprot:TRINITY_DN13841_c0_g1_i1.p1 TRINITY_DN13841_c0_g1~~TRINITY_DN13841_c0_g1_i1.p1  ORF type:complete len:574 (+),score=149.98 TRINITY_DN13841_c0_g1_i1:170-1723(+)